MSEYTGLILSSKEELEKAQLLQAEFSRIEINTLRWDQVRRRGMLLPALINEVENKFQFAVILLTPDDRISYRDENLKAPRDNVILELGLWLGKVGPNRTFIVTPSEDFKLPTDLDGLLRDSYDPSMIDSSLGPICLLIKKHLENLCEAGDANESYFEILPYDENDLTKRHHAIKKRIIFASTGEIVKFIAITAKNFICPDLRQGESSIFIDAINKDVIFNGIVLNPDSEQAKLRSEIETPGLPTSESLLMKDAKIVKNWLVEKHKIYGVSTEILRKSKIKYCSLPLSFSLWLFSDFALIEPYHYGKFPGVPHLCGFSLMKIKKNTHEYEALEKHFELLWERSKNIC
jgi:hypothetical protein